MRSNLVLIDSKLKDTDILVSALNSQTIGIVYNYDTSRNDLLSQIETKFTDKTIQRIAICCHEGETRFLENETFFSMDNEVIKNANTQFIIDLLIDYNVVNIDYLACSSLKYDSWKDYFDLIENETQGVTVGASEDETGNIKYGGNWLMENTGEQVDTIYFNKGLEYYKHLLSDFNPPYTEIMYNSTDSNDYRKDLDTSGISAGLTTYYKLIYTDCDTKTSGDIWVRNHYTKVEIEWKQNSVPDSTNVTGFQLINKEFTTSQGIRNDHLLSNFGGIRLATHSSMKYTCNKFDTIWLGLDIPIQQQWGGTEGFHALSNPVTFGSGTTNRGTTADTIRLYMAQENTFTITMNKITLTTYEIIVSFSLPLESNILNLNNYVSFSNSLNIQSYNIPLYSENIYNGIIKYEENIYENNSSITISDGKNEEIVIFSVNTFLELSVFEIDPLLVTVENHGTINMEFDNEISETDISNSLSVIPSNAGTIIDILNTTGYVWTATFVPNYDLSLSDCSLQFINTGYSINETINFNIETLQQIQSIVLTPENIITDLSSNLHVELLIPSTVAPTIQIEPSYIASLDGSMNTVDNGLNWTGTIKRTEGMNRLDNTITVEIDGFSSEISFDVVESEELIDWILDKNIQPNTVCFPTISTDNKTLVYYDVSENLIKTYYDGSLIESEDYFVGINPYVNTNSGINICLSDDGKTLLLLSAISIQVKKINSEKSGWINKGSNLSLFQEGFETNLFILSNQIMSLDGNTLIICRQIEIVRNTVTPSSSYVAVYTYNEVSDIWTQKGTKLLTTSRNEVASLSGDGNNIVVCYSSSEQENGQTYKFIWRRFICYYWNETSNEWLIKGNLILSNSRIYQLGYAHQHLAISENGTRVFILYSIGGINCNMKLFDLIDDNWVEKTHIPFPNDSGDYWRQPINMSPDGKLFSYYSTNNILTIIDDNGNKLLDKRIQPDPIIHTHPNSFNNMIYNNKFIYSNNNEIIKYEMLLSRKISDISLNPLDITRDANFEIDLTTNDVPFSEISGNVILDPSNVATISNLRLTNHGFKIEGTIEANELTKSDINKLKYTEIMDSTNILITGGSTNVPYYTYSINGSETINAETDIILPISQSYTFTRTDSDHPFKIGENGAISGGTSIELTYTDLQDATWECTSHPSMNGEFQFEDYNIQFSINTNTYH